MGQRGQEKKQGTSEEALALIRSKMQKPQPREGAAMEDRVGLMPSDVH